MEVFFPGSSTAKRKFETEIIEIEPRKSDNVNGIAVTAVEVRRACDAPPLALRIACDGRTIVYSGDTEWTDALIEIGRSADLFIVEALSFEKKVPQHLDYATFRANANRIGAKRTILTHVGPDMLAHATRTDHEIAHDGLIIDV